jgi:hypothetical protein
MILDAVSMMRFGSVRRRLDLLARNDGAGDDQQ